MCVYVCAYVCMYVCMYVLCMCMCVCVHHMQEGVGGGTAASGPAAIPSLSSSWYWG